VKLVSSTPKTVTLTLSRKEARELANVAFDQKSYFDDALYYAREKGETNEVSKWRSLRNWWDRVAGQLADAAWKGGDDAA